MKESRLADYDLFIFDLDDTLLPAGGATLYPVVLAWFQANSWRKIAIATNQGGIGLRYWMEQDKFGDPSRLPTVEDFEARIDEIFPTADSKPPVFMCARYQSKSTGKWSPAPTLRQAPK